MVGICVRFSRWHIVCTAHCISTRAPDDAKKVQYMREQVAACEDPFEVEPSVPAPIRRVRRLPVVVVMGMFVSCAVCLLGVAVDGLEDS